MSEDTGGCPEDEGASTPFAQTLRRGVQARGLSLRAIRGRLRDRGYEVGVATLSLWQSGARRPQRGVSYDVLRELEDILHLDEGELENALGPIRRVHAGSHVPFAVHIGLADHPLATEVESELIERSGTQGIYIDDQGSIMRILDRTLWQARKDGAQHATVYTTYAESAAGPPEFHGTFGCELIDIEIDPQARLLRGTMRLSSALNQGDLAIAEREVLHTPQTEPDQRIEVVAPRRQAGLIAYASFSPDLLPTRVRATITTPETSTSHVVHLNGVVATHAEPDFGPGSIALEWEW